MSRSTHSHRFFEPAAYEVGTLLAHFEASRNGSTAVDGGTVTALNSATPGLPGTSAFGTNPFIQINYQQNHSIFCGATANNSMFRVTSGNTFYKNLTAATHVWVGQHSDSTPSGTRGVFGCTKNSGGDVRMRLLLAASGAYSFQSVRLDSESPGSLVITSTAAGVATEVPCSLILVMDYVARTFTLYRNATSILTGVPSISSGTLSNTNCSGGFCVMGEPVNGNAPDAQWYHYSCLAGAATLAQVQAMHAGLKRQYAFLP